MKTTIVRLVAILLLTPAFVATSGCVAARNAATDTVGWVRGALEKVVDAPLDRVGKAATAAVNEMKFLDVTSKVDAIEGEITARTAQDTRITILLKKVTPKTTKISIRVGVFGDEAVSNQIFEAMQKRF